LRAAHDIVSGPRGIVAVAPAPARPARVVNRAGAAP